MQDLRRQRDPEDFELRQREELQREERWREWARQERSAGVWAGEMRRMESVRLPVTTKWEYKVVDIGFFFVQSRLESTLARLGQDGWELVTVYDKASNLGTGMEKGFVLFKRPLRTLADIFTDLSADERAQEEWQELRRRQEAAAGDQTAVWSVVLVEAGLSHAAVGQVLEKLHPSKSVDLSQLLTTLPSVVLEGATLGQATQAKRQLEAAGATVTLR